MAETKDVKPYFHREVGPDGVATLTLDCPGPVNTLSEAMNKQLDTLLCGL